ncbi:MAG TPA: hypothetical protein VF228_12885, partial [Iamia sp.]
MSHPRLVAVTRRLAEPVDPAAVARDDGVLLARADGTTIGTRGTVRRLPVAEAAAVLAAAGVDDPVDRPGSGPLAVGALPFRPGSDAELIVPATAVVVAPDGGAWLTTVGVEGAEPPDPATVDLDELTAPSPPRPGPGRFEVASAR